MRWSGAQAANLSVSVTFPPRARCQDMHRHTPLALGATLLTLAMPASALADWTTPENVALPQGAVGTLSGYGDGAAVGHGYTNLVGAVRRTGKTIGSPFMAKVGDTYEHTVDVQQAGDGQLTALARRQRPRLPFRIRASVVAADGSSTVGPVTLSPSKRSAVNPVLSVARDGTAVAAWAYRDSAQSGWYVQAAVRKPGQARFAPAQALSAAPTTEVATRPQIRVSAGNGGRVAVAWFYPHEHYSETPVDRPLFVRTSAQNGTFSEPQAFSGGGGWPAVSMAYSPSGEELTLGLTRSGNDSWHETATTAVTIGASGSPLPAPSQLGSGGEGFAGPPTLAYAADGSEVLGWIQPSNLNGPGGKLLVATRSAGGAFGALEPLASVPANPEYVRIAAGRGGKAVIAWEKYVRALPDDIGTTPLYAVYASVRPDGSSPFGPAVQISADGDSVVSPDVVVTDNGDVVASFRTYADIRYEMTMLKQD